MVEFEPGPNVFRTPAGEGALVVWADGTVISANAVAASAFGRARGDVVGRPLHGLAPSPLGADGQPLPPDRCPVRLVLHTGLGVNDVVVGLAVGGMTRWWSVSCRALVDDDRRVTGVACTMDEVAAPHGSSRAFAGPSGVVAALASLPTGPDVDALDLESLARLAGLVLPDDVRTADSPWARRAG